MCVCVCTQLHARELSLTEVRASAEILQSASAQMQVCDTQPLSHSITNNPQAHIRTHTRTHTH